MEWTQSNVEDCIDILKNSPSVQAACERISNEYEERISVDQLGSAFRRKDFVNNPPSHFISEDVQKSDTNIETNSINITDNAYVCDFEGTIKQLSHEEVEVAFLLYGSKGPGKGKTAAEVAQYFYNRGKNWASERFFTWFFTELGYKKSLIPQAPHHFGMDDDEIFNRLYNIKDNLISGEKNSNLITKQSKLIDDLKEENRDLKMIKGQCLRDKEVYRVDAKDKKENFGERTLIIPVADLHNGKKVDDNKYEKTKNIFNKNIFWDRISQICGRIKRISQHYHQEYDSVYIAGLGDYFEALLLNMRQFQHLTADNAGMEQFFAVKNAWINIIDTVLEYFDDIPVKAMIQGGNHDRLTENKGADSEELVAAWLADTLSEHFQSVNRLDIDFGAAVVSYMLNDNHNLITLHGHHKKLKPKNANIAHFKDVHGFSHAKWYTILIGHFHNFKVMTANNARAIWVPSVCGDDKYSRVKIQKTAPAEWLAVDLKEKRSEQRFLGPYSLDMGT